MKSLMNRNRPIVSVLPQLWVREGILVQVQVRFMGRMGIFVLPAALFAVFEEGAVAVHFQCPAALDATAVAPVDVGDDIGVAGIPFLGCGEERI